jgi:hypothetical protein
MLRTTTASRIGMVSLLLGLLTTSLLVDNSESFSSTSINSFSYSGDKVRLLSHPNINNYPPSLQLPLTSCQARRPRDEDEDYDDDDDDDDYDYDDDDDSNRRRRRRRRRNDNNELDDLGYNRRKEDGFLNIPSSFGERDGLRLPDALSKSLLAGIFVLGIGLGVTIDSAINTNPRDLASRDAIDQAAPNAKLCADMGASAMAFDQRVFVSFNPFNVYVAQADVKPACVLRSSNIVPILKDRKLINDKEVFACKSNMNTWAFVGDLDNKPQLSCVYKSEDAQNEFLENPKYGIGEDYLDDDRSKMKDAKKRIKDGMTDAQKQEIIRKQAAKLPGLD